MKRITKVSILGASIVALVAILISKWYGSHTTTPSQEIRKTIVTKFGEVTKETKYVGERTRYRVYYHNPYRSSVAIQIEDLIDVHLSNLSVLNGGAYDSGTRVAHWEIGLLAPNSKGFVELEGEVGQATQIENKAKITFYFVKKSVQQEIKIDPKIKTQLDKREVITNSVVTLVCTPPRVGWIPFEPTSQKGSMPRTQIKDETTSGIMLNFETPGMFVQEWKHGTDLYHRISLPGHASSLDLGKPELPIIGRVIEIPYGINPDIEIIKTKTLHLKCYNVWPAQKPKPRSQANEEEEFLIDGPTYVQDTDFPVQPVVIKTQDMGIVRGHRLLFLKAYPIQYNPVTRDMTVLYQLEVRVRYDHPAQIQRVAKRVESRPFEDLLSGIVVNYKSIGRFGGTEQTNRKETDGCDYLIITDGAFYNSADPNNPIVRLQQWKRSKGLLTRVVDVANIPGTGGQAANIDAYLQTAYDTWLPAPTYVLLVGDADLVAPSYRINHQRHNNTPVGSDNSYAMVDGTDYFPDILIGRLSVDTLQQATTAIDKILNYERTPPNVPNYYTDMPLVALFEDTNSDGQENSGFYIIEFAEEIFNFLNNNTYNPIRIYAQSGTGTPQNYENGTTITGLPSGFAWNGGTADIRTAIQGGTSLITYDGHGSPSLWDRPRFSIANITALTNGALTPVVFSLACMTGWFDNETDAANADWDTLTPGNQTLGNADESFCEEFIRSNRGGAVGIIGSSRVSWPNNDFMMLGLFKAVWPDFNPQPTSHGPNALPGINSSALLHLGQVNTFSKVYMANYYNHDQFREETFEMYNLFGDPEMTLWTHQPVPLSVEYPRSIGSTGQQDFVVKVSNSTDGTPVQDAVVTFVKDGIMMDSKMTNPGGIARFTWTSPEAGDINLTVIATNFLPFENQIKATSGGADINRLDPDNGITGQSAVVGGTNFDGSENVAIIFDGNPLLTKQAANGIFGQAGVEDVSFSVPSTQPLGPINIVAQGASSGRTGVDVFYVRTANPIDLFMYSQWDSSTWHLNTNSSDNPTWDNPDIQLYDSSGSTVDSNNLTVGHNYTIKAKIHNNTGFNAQRVQVSFYRAGFGVGQPDNNWDRIDRTDRPVIIDVPGNSTVTAEVPWAPTQPGHQCLQVQIYHIEDIIGANNVGQENCDVGPTSSPRVVPFTVWNPTDKPAMVYLELRQLFTPETINKIYWRSSIRHPDPQLLQPGEKRDGEVIIEPVAQKRGARAEFSLTAFIRGKMIGGANFKVIVR